MFKDVSKIVKIPYFIFTIILIYFLPEGERGGLVVNASDSGSRGRGFEPHSGQNRVVSLSKAHLLPKSTGNTQEVVAPS